MSEYKHSPGRSSYFVFLIEVFIYRLSTSRFSKRTIVKWNGSATMGQNSLGCEIYNFHEFSLAPGHVVTPVSLLETIQMGQSATR